MLTFLVNDTTVNIERESIEARLQESIAARLEESKDVAPMLRSALKGVAELILPMVGLKAPKGEDKLAYLTSYVMKLAFDALENQTIPVDGNVIVKEVLPFELSDEEVNADAD